MSSRRTHRRAKVLEELPEELLTKVIGGLSRQSLRSTSTVDKLLRDLSFPKRKEDYNVVLKETLKFYARICEALGVDTVLPPSLRDGAIGDAKLRTDKAITEFEYYHTFIIYVSSLPSESVIPELKKFLPSEHCVFQKIDLNQIAFDQPPHVAAGLADAITAALRGNRMLTELYLGSNDLGDEGATAIGNALAENRVLKTLSLVGNNVGDNGAIAITNALRDNGGVLKNLWIGANNIGDTGAFAIANALRNGLLTSIDLVGNNFTDLGKEAIRHAVSGREGFTLRMW